MVATFTSDFNVTWDDPADEQLTWLFDPMHQPDPMCQLAAEFHERMFGTYMSSRSVCVNGYGYSTQPMPRPPSPEILARGVVDVWTNDYLPQIQASCDRLRGADYESLRLDAFADRIDGIMSETIHAFGYTMKPITGFMGPTFGFVEFLQTELGPEGPLLVATLLQGFENGTAAAGAGLGQLAEEAANLPAVAEALRKGDFDAIEGVEGGATFLAQFRSYLERYGWRVDSWGLLDRPTWAENPRMPLTLISHYIADPKRSPAVAHARAIAQREQAVRDVEARLNSDKLPQFRAMLTASQGHVPISEGRALWQLIIIGSLRVPVLALGRKLAAAGALNSPEHAFFFDSAELAEAARNPTPQTAATGEQRKADFADWHKLTPPPFLGAPPDMGQLPAEVVPLMTLFFGIAQPNVEGRVITGQAASKGIARGRARVLKDLGEAERLQPGDVLVCATTAPPWTPLFAIAAAVVTDSGGVLSHSAICAREYAIPCVVATQVGTTLIKDGAMVTVDGTKGIVQMDG